MHCFPPKKSRSLNRLRLPHSSEARARSLVHCRARFVDSAAKADAAEFSLVMLYHERNLIWAICWGISYFRGVEKLIGLKSERGR